jgi:putative transposase
LLLKNEYLVAENRILKAHIRGRLLLSDGEKATLAEIAKRLGRQALAQIAGVAKLRYDSGLVRKVDCQEVRRVQAARRPRASTGRTGA